MRNLQKLVLLIVVQVIITGGVRVDPKLDFEADSELLKVKKEIKGGKIKGLRVTVDTSELKGSRENVKYGILKNMSQRLSAESRSSGSDSSSSSESAEKKKTVGVRTDVTFEITSGESNDTKTVDEKEIGKDDDNASIPLVPVFKGTPQRGIIKGPTKDPNFNDIWSVKPLDNPSPPRENPSASRGPIFHKTDDERGRYGGGDDSWRQYPQYAIWTTERYNRKQHNPPVYHHRGCSSDSMC